MNDKLQKVIAYIAKHLDTGEELADLPCIFCYYNFDHEVADTELLTECWLLLK